MATKMLRSFLHKKQKICNATRAGLGLGESLTDELIQEACLRAMNAHVSSNKLYLVDKPSSLLNTVIFSFPGCFSVKDWFTGNAFGEKKIDLVQFPSLKTIATEEVATVNEAFLNRFQELSSKIQHEVEKYLKKGKQIVFTGHSSGGPIAILVTIWFLHEELKRPDPKDRFSPLCITFGSPLVGDHIFNHALSRENWLQYFTHFIMRYDIAPRVLLSPLSSIEQQLICILPFLKPKSNLEQVPSAEASTLYKNVMSNASFLASNAACNLMGKTNNLLETLSICVESSPYRPFGAYVFCTEEELVVVKNPDAVLLTLFYSSQLQSGQEGPGIAMRSIKDHQNYHSELENLEKKNVTHLDSLKELPFSSNCNDVVTDKVLNNLGLSSRARLCLCAARESEKQKIRNQDKFDAEETDIIKRLDWLQTYKDSCENRKLSYYDAFKISTIRDDFTANVERLKLAGTFDELMEMIKNHELPHGFEVNNEWIDIGTRHRCLVEPLDIANYYRHGRNFDSKSNSKSKPYMKDGRPKRYRFPQKWLEYNRRMKTESIPQSCFWAEVEELDVCLKSRENGNEELSDDVKERILSLEKNVKAWVESVDDKKLGLDIFFEDSTFIKWWETLPQQYRLETSFSGFISEQQKLLKESD